MCKFLSRFAFRPFDNRHCRTKGDFVVFPTHQNDKPVHCLCRVLLCDVFRSPADRTFFLGQPWPSRASRVSLLEFHVFSRLLNTIQRPKHSIFRPIADDDPVHAHLTARRGDLNVNVSRTLEALR